MPNIIRMLVASLALGMLCEASAWSADLDSVRRFDIRAQRLDSALLEFSKQADLQVIGATDTLANSITQGVTGKLRSRDALTNLLRGTALSFDAVGSHTVRIIAVQDAATHQGTNGDAHSEAAGANADAAQEPAAAAPVAGADAQTTANSASEQERRADLGELVVTGSHIRRASVEGPAPVTVITRKQIDRSGHSTVAGVLRDLPQNLGFRNESNGLFVGPVGQSAPGVDLRGLGAENTLVLVNGRRIASSAAGPTPLVGVSYVNLNNVPLAAVDRIEVLTDGASALYGSDAVAGVVNIILKQEFTGTDFSARYGDTSGGEGAERELTVTTGIDAGRANALLTVDYFDRDPLANGTRAFAASDDLRPFGGSDWRNPVGGGNPGTVFALGPSLPGLSDTPFAAVPSGQNGQNLTPADFQATALQMTTVDTRQWGALVPETQRWGANGRLSLEMGEELGAYFEAGWTRNEMSLEAAPPLVFFQAVPPDNPYNPFGDFVLASWMLAETGPLRTESSNSAWRGLLGMHGAIGATWNWDSAFAYSRDEVEQVTPNQRSLAGFAAALNSSDPATALNVFGDGAGANSPAVLAAITAPQIIAGEGESRSWDAKFDGVLARLGGREWRAAAGVEYREERFDSTSIFPTAPPTSSVNVPADGERQLKSAFLELSIPVFLAEHQVPGFRELELQLAGRGEHYSDKFGSSVNPKVALRWQPVESIALRASWGTAFRGPALFQLYRQPLVSQGAAFDPARNDELAFYTDISGGNPDLEAEESESLSIGLTFDVPFVRGLSLGADHYEIEEQDRIAQLFPDEMLASESLFASRIVRNPLTPQDIAAGLTVGSLNTIDRTFTNVGRIAIRGTDLRLTYRRDSNVGTFELRTNGAYVDSYRRQLTPLSPTQELVDTADGNPVRFRATGALFWSHAGWEAGITERYVGSYEDVSAARTIGSGSETDLQVGYAWPAAAANAGGLMSGTRITLGIDNVFDEEPPFRDLPGGYDPTYYSARMRFVYAVLRKSF